VGKLAKAPKVFGNGRHVVELDQMSLLAFKYLLKEVVSFASTFINTIYRLTN